MGPGDGNYDGNRYHKKPILRFGDFTDRFNANRMNRSQYAPEKCMQIQGAESEKSVALGHAIKSFQV